MRIIIGRIAQTYFLRGVATSFRTNVPVPSFRGKESAEKTAAEPPTSSPKNAKCGKTPFGQHVLTTKDFFGA